ncbi:hypothetical protein SprV_0401697900 [Sparganum proliferum]
MDAHRDERPGICIAYRTDGHLFNQRRVHFRLRVSTTIVHELHIVDDCALNTTSQGDMQRSVDLLFADACDNFGLIINTEKAVIMHQPLPINAHNASQISLDGIQLQGMESFTYVCSALSHSTKIDDEVVRWISKPSVFFKVQFGIVTVTNSA